MARTSYLLGEDPATDLIVAQTMVDELEDYILQAEVYRTITVAGATSGDPRIQMSGGDLLTRFHRLRGQQDQLSSAEQGRLDTLQSQADSIIATHRSGFHTRLEREMKTRLNSIKWFLDDCSGDAQRCRVDFPFEMRNRQRIEEIVKALGDEMPAEIATTLKAIDQRIQKIAYGAPFIWDASLEDVFPRSPYWYLYLLPSGG